MQSKNKRAPSAAERSYITLIKSLDCGCCGRTGPSEAHEIEQGQWFTSIPLCEDCHRGGHNGIHGQRRIWAVLKKSELSVLNETIERVVALLVARSGARALI
ncbi:hypothetical protein [Burkholderia vietnamiensis]|uniref:hypothetical protein n=1 Tax=Burkholderia vietnamiensis TaxID=60552 RepID=UPI002DD4296D|nr:hypothetical protein [Burkholderia vietnamiensis]MEC4595475.1 hypothetical protein [Burkholderia vietnamiensis]HDR8950771.1 hypothetical protein [Burkholderia vietnamiensis]